MFKNALLMLPLITLVACAHHRDVRPSADGVHTVIIKTDDQDEGYREGMAQATDYCKELGQKPYVANEASNYSGSMNEKDYKTAKTTAKVAKTAGGALMVFGGQNEKQFGGVAALGGVVGDSALGQGYVYKMRFSCK